MQETRDEIGSVRGSGQQAHQAAAIDRRLSAAECRTLLDRGGDLSDAEILHIRDVLYDVAEVAIDSLADQPQKTDRVRDIVD